MRVDEMLPDEFEFLQNGWMPQESSPQEGFYAYLYDIEDCILMLSFNVYERSAQFSFKISKPVEVDVTICCEGFIRARFSKNHSIFFEYDEKSYKIISSLVFFPKISIEWAGLVV